MAPPLGLMSTRMSGISGACGKVPVASVTREAWQPMSSERPSPTCPTPTCEGSLSGARRCLLPSEFLPPWSCSPLINSKRENQIQNSPFAIFHYFMRCRSTRAISRPSILPTLPPAPPPVASEQSAGSSSQSFLNIALSPDNKDWSSERPQSRGQPQTSDFPPRWEGGAGQTAGQTGSDWRTGTREELLEPAHK